MTPITYLPNFVPKERADRLFETLRTSLAWVQHEDAPRGEYYCTDQWKPYTYGRGDGQRTYQPQPWTPEIREIQTWVRGFLSGTELDVCFLNRYDTERNHLGWHSDDSPEMDPQRPIAIVSLGEAREIWFAPKSEKNPDSKDLDKILLGHGSLCVMAAGMQQTHIHKIPKAGFKCKSARISLTFRGYREA